jgi:hypothetical protein
LRWAARDGQLQLTAPLQGSHDWDRAGKQRQFRASGERHLMGDQLAALHSLFSRKIQKTVSFLVSFPPPAAKRSCAVVAIPASRPTSRPVPVAGLVDRLHQSYSARRRSVPRGAPRSSWLGRSLGRAAVVVRAVKLVHQCIESGEAGMGFWPPLPVSKPRRSCSPPSAAAWSRHSTARAVARCLLDRTMVHAAPTFFGRRAIFTAKTALGPSA